MTKKTSNLHQWKPGQSGNPLGRPKRPEIEELRKALAAAKKENNLGFLEMFVKKAYTEQPYALELFKKIIPAESFITKNTQKLVFDIRGKLDKGKRVKVDNLNDKEERDA